MESVLPENGIPCECAPDEEEVINYGPCACESRKTLFQWSYGTSFSGGASLDEPLATDRPDFTEASSTVGRGVRQLEFGYTYTFDRSATSVDHVHSLPEALFRYGVLYDWLELRLAVNCSEEVTATGGVRTSVRGMNDLYLGTKIGLTPQEGVLPEMAVILQATAPTGSADLTVDEFLPGLNWLYGWDITERISTAGSTQFNRAVDDVTGDTYLLGAQSWTIGYGLAENLNAFTEWFTLFPSGAETQKAQCYFDGGFQFFVSKDFALDIRAGVGLNEAANDYFIGSGGAVRF